LAEPVQAQVLLDQVRSQRVERCESRLLEAEGHLLPEQLEAWVTQKLLLLLGEEGHLREV